MILIQQSYSSPDPRRDAELRQVRDLNASAGVFGHQEFIDCGAQRLAFADLFSLAATRFAGTICVVANSDIAFDASIRLVEPILAESAAATIVALSRWDDDTAPSMEGRIDADGWTFYSHSQDAWAFVAGSLPAFDAGFVFGLPACENRLAYEAAAAGVSIVNPALSVRLRHHHASAVRSWTHRDGYQGPMLFPRLTTTATGDRRALVVDRTGWRTRRQVVRLVGDFAAAVRGKRRQAGFSLVELLIVIAILGALVALLVPAVQRAREAGRRTACAANLHAMGLALSAHESSRRAFPPGSDAVTGRDHAWSSFILPFLDGETVARRIDYSRPWNAGGGNAEIADLVLATYVCPSGIRSFPGKQDYGGVLGTGIPLRDGEPLRPGWDHSGVLYATDAAHPRPVRAAMVTDGLAHTVTVSEGVDRGFADMDGESRIGNARWACGTNCFLQNSRVVNTPDVDGFRGNHPGGVHALFADGRVAFLTEDTAAEVLLAISTKDWGDGPGAAP
ncbi:MAG: DUF1559 domain-containing protein [Planctomycetaceae bacterium]